MELPTRLGGFWGLAAATVAFGALAGYFWRGKSSRDASRPLNASECGVEERNQAEKAKSENLEVPKDVQNGVESLQHEVNMSSNLMHSSESCSKRRDASRSRSASRSGSQSRRRSKSREHHGTDLERLDVWSSSGEPTGTSKLRRDVHADGDWHPCVHIWLYNAEHDVVLIQKRSATKESWASLYDISCAGHIPSGECIIDAGLRELYEEIGVVAHHEDLIRLGMVSSHHKNSG